MKPKLHLALLGLLLGAGFTAHAQTGGLYDLTWNTVAAGGTALATGGPYSLEATIGQPIADAATGDPFQLLSGFWTWPPAVEACGPLTIELVGGEVLITWPAGFDCVLESCDALAFPPVWSPVMPAPADHRLSVPATSAAQFFRLRSP